VLAYRAQDPAGWGTGLSPEGARLALRSATGVFRTLAPDWPEDLQPPQRLVVWCAGNVYTAPVEWVATFAGAGSTVVLKAPSSAPEPVQALARCFTEEGFDVRCETPSHEASPAVLEGADAVLGFGSDTAMKALEALLRPDQRRAIFGHRVSAAVVEGVRELPALVQDAVLYDGRGCRSPVAVFCLGDAEGVSETIAAELERAASEVPRGELEPAWGPEWRRRTGRARILGRCLEGPEWAVPVLPARHFTPEPLPRMLPVHPVPDLAAVYDAVRGLPLGRCVHNLRWDATAPLRRLGFQSLCPAGWAHATLLEGRHEGIDLLRTLGSPRR